MQRLNFTIPRPSLPCQVIIGKGILKDLPKLVDLSCYSQLILVADENLKNLTNQMRANLLRGGSDLIGHSSDGGERTKKKKVHLFFIKAGEKNKNEGQADRLLNKILEIKPPLDRRTLILALGGGVVGDLTGYVAARALRGLPFFQIPTTFLAMVDSSQGGKTGVDSDKGLTNMIGLFHLPSVVVMDIKVLETLPEKGWQEGLTELVKHAFLNKKLFNLLSFPEVSREKHLRGVNPETPREWPDKKLIKVLAFSTKFKLSVISKDFEEKTGERKVLNFGHTFGRALETASNFSLTHGEAVAIGLQATLKASYYKKILKKQTLKKCLNLLKKFNLLNHTRCEKSKGKLRTSKLIKPIKSILSLEASTPGVKELTSNPKISLNVIKKAIKYDKKTILGQPKFVLLKDIGKPKIDCQLEEELIDKVLKEVLKGSDLAATQGRTLNNI